MNITVIGAGYVGLPSAGVFAKLGHNVWLLRRDIDKIEQLKQGQIDIYEPGLSELIQDGLNSGRLHPTASYEEAIPNSEIVFICVGTPSGERGEADLTQLYDAVRSLAPHLRDFMVIADKSTVPVGTARQVERLIRGLTPEADFAVASCPEFLREGSAVEDTLNPTRIAIGVEDDRAKELLLKVHEGLPGKRFVSDIESVEMVKYASNAFLAAKISFINEIANICERVGADVEEVARGMGMDERIGPKFLKAGAGFGGSCFPKDLRALRSIAESVDYNPDIIRAVEEVNKWQRRLIVSKVQRALGFADDKVVYVLGLAFKPQTDDIRESSALEIIYLLQKQGAKIRAHDPCAIDKARRQMIQVEFIDDLMSGFEGADAVIIVTDWPEYSKIDFRQVKEKMRTPVIVDGRNLCDPKKMIEYGFKYFCVGRSEKCFKSHQILNINNQTFVETPRKMYIKPEDIRIAVIGLGYVGLPLAVAFGKTEWAPVIGFNKSKERVDALLAGHDPTKEVSDEELRAARIEYTLDPVNLERANFIVATIPTPITKANTPDLTFVHEASRTIGKHLKPGTIVVYESTVYPGVTEEECVPIIEKESGLKCGIDWKIGYSPERVNPGDKEHTIEKITKVVSGMDEETLETVAYVYGKICKGGVHKVPNIKTAEAAKVIENIQRDLNIALMNELCLIFHRLGINTREVIEAAGTKWNFHKYYPGLVGGHCYAGSQRITLLNGQSHKVRTMLDYYNELRARNMARREAIGETNLLWPKENINVLSFDKSAGKAVFAPVKCFSMREGGQGLRIKAAGNHHIEVSTRHPMIVDENGQWFVKHAQDIQVGDRVPLLQNLPKRHNLRTEIDLIQEMPKEWHRRYRVKRKAGTWREFKDVFEIKKHTGKKASNFYHLDYLPLSVYLELERQDVMPVSHDEVMLVSGRGGGSFQAIPAIIKLDADFARLAGYYLSEGCITHDKTIRVRFAFNRHEDDTIADCCSLIKKLGMLRFSRFEDKQCNTSHIKASSELLGFLFERILRLGVRSEDARIPEELLYAEDDIRWNILIGLLRGDGGVDWRYSHHPYQKNGKTYAHARNIANVSYFSISPELLYGVQLLLMSFGIPFTLCKNRPMLEIQGTENLARVRECFLDAKRKKIEEYFVHKLREPKSKIFEKHQGYVTVPVRAIEPIRLSKMYSLEVEGTNTVVTDGGFITHNCIGVDPYYLTYRAQELGYNPQVILAGRRINDWMPEYAADLMIRGLVEAGKVVQGSRVLVMGLTFKEDIRDTRNSKIHNTIKKLQSYGVRVLGYDPNLYKEEVERFGVEYVADLAIIGKVDGIILTTLHRQFKEMRLADLVKYYNGNGDGRGVFIDIKSWFISEMKQEKLIYKCL